MKRCVEKQANRHPAARGTRWIQGLGLAALAAALTGWLCAPRSALGVAAALCSAALFAVWGLRFAGVWAVAWSGGQTAERPLRESAPRELWRVYGQVLLFALLQLTAVTIILYAVRGRQTVQGVLDFWRCLDSNSYLEIAQYGYAAEGDRAVQLVFLPGYPLAVRLFHLFIPGDYAFAGLAEASACFAGAGAALYRLMKREHGCRAARRAVKFLCLLPGAFFFVAPMSESQFLLLSLLCVDCSRRGKYGAASLFGAAAAFTRTLGLVLMVPVLFDGISAWAASPPAAGRERRRFLLSLMSVALIPLGFGAYLLINRAVSGNALQFLIYQREHWSQGAGWFFNTAAYQTQYAVSSARQGSYAYLFGLWLPQLLAGAAVPVLLAAQVRRVRPSHSAYAIAYYAVAMGCTWLLSAVRYMDALLTIPEALALLASKRGRNLRLTVLLALLAAAYMLAFVKRWQVW